MMARGVVFVRQPFNGHTGIRDPFLFDLQRPDALLGFGVRYKYGSEVTLLLLFQPGSRVHTGRYTDLLFQRVPLPMV